jgi:hypothetical protein
MKKLIVLFVLLSTLITSIGIAQTYVRPYVRKDGTQVRGHYRSNPNSTTLDNYSTKGNINPYTGQKGYKDPYSNSYNTYKRKSSNTYCDPYTGYCN